MIGQDEQEFGSRGIDHRFRHGGLPPFYLARVRHPRVRYWRDKRGHEIDLSSAAGAVRPWPSSASGAPPASTHAT